MTHSSAIVLNNNPNKILVAIQQPVNDGGYYIGHDISNITY